MKQYPMARPAIGKEEMMAVARVLKSGVLSIGPELNAFEKSFADTVGTRYACAVSSGTSGLHLMMIAAGVGPGDEVITSPFSFIASANSVLYVGAKPKFVDIDPISYNMDPSRVEKAITRRTKAILVVHIFGQSCDMTPLMKIAKKHKLIVLEDACESLGAYHRGKAVGTFGEAACFAFYPNKQMTTGEGGMVVTNSKRLDERFRSLRNQGRSKNMQWLDHHELGYNYRMDEMSAAVGLEQLKKLPSILKERARIASLYSKYLTSHDRMVQTPAIALHNSHSWFVYVVKLKTAKSRDSIIAQLAKRGISSKPYLPAIHLFSFYRKKFGYRRGDFPHAEDAGDRCIALPFYQGLTDNDIKHISHQLISLLK